jgi:hypothetical protein
VSGSFPATGLFIQKGTKMSIFSDGRALPAPSQAHRDFANFSKTHGTTFTVLGDGPGKVTQGDSYTELCRLHLLAVRPDVVDVREQVFFKYGHRNEHEHFFDALATLRSSVWIAFTVKPEVSLKSGRFLSKMQDVAYWVQRNRFADSVPRLTKADTDRTDLHNADILVSLRDRDSEAEVAARSIAGKPSMGATIERAFLAASNGLREKSGGRVSPGILGIGFINPETLVQGKGKGQ